MADILVVEPDRNQRLLVEEALAERGHLVDAVASTDAALARLKSAPPDLVILEIVDRRLDGLRLLGRVLGGRQHVPVIVHTTDATFPSALIAGLVDAAVVKNSNLQPLLAAVGRVLRRNSLFSAPWRRLDMEAEMAEAALS